MAYLQQNPEDEKNQQNSQVLGPSGQPINQPQQQSPAGGASQPATIEGSQPGANVPQTPAVKKPSSGQFTNLRNYLQASQGAGQKIGQQLTGGMQRQAQQVGKALEQQKAQYQAQIGQQEAQRAQAGQAAQATLNKLTSPKPNDMARDEYLKNTLKNQYDPFKQEQQAIISRSESQFVGNNKKQEDLNNLYKKYNIDQQALERAPYEISEQEVAKFRELATGQKTFKDVQDMNLAAEQVKQQQLAAQAEALKSFEGRAGQLRETFGKNRQYGQGSSTLDSLLLQRQGLPQVLETTKGIQQGLGEQIKGTKQFGSSELARLLQENKAFAQGLQTAAETGQTGVVSAVDQLRAQRAAERAAQLQENLNPFLTEEQKQLQELENFYGGENIRQRLIDQARATRGSTFNQSIDQELRIQAQQSGKKNPSQQELDSMREQKIQEFIKTGQGLNRIALNEHDWDWRVKQILENTFKGEDEDTLKNLGTSQQDMINKLYNAYGVGGKYISSQQFNDYINSINKQLENQRTNLPKTLSERLKQATGYGFEDYTTGRDLTRESVASEADRARYAALSALAGREATDLAFSRPADAKAGTDLTRSQLSELLAKLSTEFGRTNNTVPNTAGYGEPKKNIE